ncbi:MAG: hypothetical protein NT039_01580 [Candidatus Berkelbacteria bacterium]|nr:hypothetical protein [Candidatus Berkelbacteria bacterium]
MNQVQIALMTNPKRDPMAEIVRIASEEVRVVELTLEGDWYADKWRRQGEEQQK